MIMSKSQRPTLTAAAIDCHALLESHQSDDGYSGDDSCCSALLDLEAFGQHVGLEEEISALQLEPDHVRTVFMDSCLNCGDECSQLGICIGVFCTYCCEICYGLHCCNIKCGCSTNNTTVQYRRQSTSSDDISDDPYVIFDGATPSTTPAVPCLTVLDTVTHPPTITNPRTRRLIDYRSTNSTAEAARQISGQLRIQNAILTHHYLLRALLATATHCIHG